MQSLRILYHIQRAFIFVLPFSLGACTPAKMESLSGDSSVEANSVITASHFDVNSYPINKVVCDPFTGATPPSVDHGIKATLFYKTSAQPAFNNVLDMVTQTHMSEQNLFFADMNVPTRLFQAGFATQSSDFVKDDSGQKLVEHFGLRMNTEIVLSPEDEEGLYQFAVLADDGVRMSIGNPGQLTEIINNDGIHPTKMGCAQTAQPLTKSTRLGTEVLYYQGPRFHIANVLLWRKVSGTASSLGETLCDRSGNNFFFDPNRSSLPLNPYRDLLTRGWKPLSKENFLLPGTSESSVDDLRMTYNPCYQGVAPQILNLRAGESFSSEADIFWDTDIPSTAQLLVVQIATGATQLTESDNLLRTHHHIQLKGLTPNSNYRIQAISISANMGRQISPIPLEIRTLP